MKKYFVTLTCLMCISVLNAQRVRYAFRIRNFTIETETNSVYLINSTIFQHGAEHRFNAQANLTEDVQVKALQVTLHRCVFEKSACEYFQTWRLKDNFNSVVYMKNQMWTPVVTDITPRVNLPGIKKNIYKLRDGTLDANATVLFYPEITKYYWIVDVILIDTNDKKAIVLVLECTIFEYVERSKKRNPPNTKV